jgi:ABC-2 type transport system permease protein
MAASADALKINAVKPLKRSKFEWALRDSWTLIKRSILHIVKSPDQLMSTLFQPIMFTLLFVYIFGGEVKTGTSYINFLMAGIIVQSSAFGATYTSLGVATDMQRGIVDRFKSLPMLSSAMLIGHTVADLVRNTISTLIMIAVGLAVGFRPTASPLEWLAIFGVLMLFTFSFSWLSAIMGLLAKTVEAVQWIGFVFVFPLTFASSAFVPTTNMPKYLKLFAENQPVTHVIESIRGLLLGRPLGDHVWWTVFWSLLLLIICIPVAGIMFRRYASR